MSLSISQHQVLTILLKIIWLNFDEPQVFWTVCDKFEVDPVFKIWCQSKVVFINTNGLLMLVQNVNVFLFVLIGYV